jgi:hypothetical protein
MKICAAALQTIKPARFAQSKVSGLAVKNRSLPSNSERSKLRRARIVPASTAFSENNINNTAIKPPTPKTARANEKRITIFELTV